MCEQRLHQGATAPMLQRPPAPLLLSLACTASCFYKCHAPERGVHGVLPARSRSAEAEPKGLNRPSQLKGRLGARELTDGWHLNLSMLSDPSVCWGYLRTQLLVAHTPLSL
jgi:hypothetical protein